jgi:hypothetical protein
MNQQTLSRIGKTALKIYANHMISFTIGAILGAFTAFTVLTPYIVAAAR